MEKDYKIMQELGIGDKTIFTGEKPWMKSESIITLEMFLLMHPKVKHKV